MRGVPDLAIITGSTTRGNPSFDTVDATSSMISLVPSIPVFPASIPMSSHTAIICDLTSEGWRHCASLTS